MVVSAPGSTWIHPHSRKFVESVNLLKKQFVNNQGIPLCLTCGTSRRFTATTATALLALYYIGHLTDEMRIQFHETIFACKNTHEGATAPQPDTVAWDPQEGFSPWITALAIWALLGTKYSGPRWGEIKEATLWLLQQRQPNGMWGRLPQDTTDLLSTSMTLHALKLVSAAAPALGLTAMEAETVLRVRKDTLGILRKLAQEQGNCISWTGQTEFGVQPDPTATLCAIWALHDSKGFDPDKTEEDSKLIEGGIRYLRKTLHRLIPMAPLHKIRTRRLSPIRTGQRRRTRMVTLDKIRTDQTMPIRIRALATMSHQSSPYLWARPLLNCLSSISKS